MRQQQAFGHSGRFSPPARREFSEL